MFNAWYFLGSVGSLFLYLAIGIWRYHSRGSTPLVLNPLYYWAERMMPNLSDVGHDGPPLSLPQDPQIGSGERDIHIGKQERDGLIKDGCTSSGTGRGQGPRILDAGCYESFIHQKLIGISRRDVKCCSTCGSSLHCL